MTSESPTPLFRTEKQKAVFAALLGKIGAGPAALYTDACTLRGGPEMLIASAPFVAHALREVERAIAGRLSPVPLWTCARCGRQRRDTAAQMATIATLGVFPEIQLLKSLRGEANELAHRAGLQRPRSFDADFTTRAARFDESLSSVLTSLAVPVSAAAASEFMERLSIRSSALDIRPTERERKVLDSLLNKAAPGPAAWYADALALQDDRFSFLLARANLTAHALREAESALRAVLRTREFVANKCEECLEPINGHEQDIAAILDAYGIANESEAARLWRQFASPDGADGLAGLAHKSSLDFPKPFDETTAEVFRNVTAIFAALLAKFDDTFGRYVHLLDELLAGKNVGKKVFTNSIPHTDLTYDYFFTRATNPRWMTALRDHDAFRLTPEPYRRDGAVVWPAWPQGVYLRRLLEAPPTDVDEILRVFDRATASANPRVHEHVVGAALLMTPEQRRHIAERERSWLEAGRYVPFLLGEALGELAVALVADGATLLGVSIVGHLLQLIAFAENDEKDLRLRVDRVTYEHLLEKVVPNIAPASGTAILSVVADALDTLRNLERPTLTAPPTDYSYIWRAAIEPNERNLRCSLRDALIDSLRDASEAIIGADQDALPAMITWFESRQWNIYRRIGLHLVAGSTHAALATTLASRAEYLDELDLGHEMARMLHAHEGQLHDDIPEELLTRRKALATAEPPLGGAQAFWPQEHSPISRDVVEAMSVAGLVDFIRSWTPAPRDFFLIGQTHDAFAGVIRNVVPQRASEFSAAAMLFASLPPTYIRNLLEGLDEVIQHDHSIEWQPVMALGLCLADQERAASDHRVIDPLGEEETWRYVRQAFLDLLEHAMCRDTPLMPPSHWRTVWHLLQRFALDPDVGDGNGAVVDAEEDARAVVFTLNSVSGKALSLLIRLPTVLRQMHLSAGEVEAMRSHVFDVIQSHLQAVEAAVPTFTVIGRHFVDLIGFDPNRARELAALLFSPTDAGRAAWKAYLMTGVLAGWSVLLRQQYSEAIDVLDRTSTEASYLEKCLAAHVLTLYLRSGVVTFDNDDLVARFFSHASPTLRTEALWDVSRRLGTMPESALPTHVALWEWCAHSLPPDELDAFESWACSGRFNESWVLDQLHDLSMRGTELSCYPLVEYLEEIFDKDPQRITRSLAALIEHQTVEHEVHAVRQAIRSIVKRSHDAGEPARQEGRRLANLMTARGFYDFNELT